jgi:soluble lytic murein transglycosylase-like protein
MFAVGTLLVVVVWAQGNTVPKETPAVKADPEASKPKIPEKPMSGIERQRLSVERQMQAIQTAYPQPFSWSAGNVVASSAPPPSDCPPISAAAAKTIIDREATRHKMDAKLVQAVVEAESAYSPCAVSPVGAMGLMQLMPSTAESLQVTDPYDPSQNITAGTQYLKQMLERYGGDIAKALAAYNAGPARVDAAGGVPAIPETQEYVRKIMGKITPPRPVE